MSKRAQYAVTVALPTDYFESVVDRYARGDIGDLSFALRGAGEARRTSSLLVLDDQRNEVTVIDVTDMIQSKEYAPQEGHSVVTIRASGTSVESLGEDIITAAGIDPLMLVSIADQFSHVIDTPQMAERFEEAVTLMAIAQWVTTPARGPMLVAHAADGNEATMLLRQLTLAMPPFVRDYIPLFILNTGLRTAANALLGFESLVGLYPSVTIPRRTVMLLEGLIDDDVPEPGVGAGAKIPIDRFDGRKLVSALKNSGSKVPSFVHSFLDVAALTSDTSDRGEPQPDEEAQRKIADLQRRLESAEKNLATAQAEVVTLARKLRLAEYEPKDVAASGSVIEALVEEGGSPEVSTRRDWEEFDRLLGIPLPDSMRDLCSLAREHLKRVGLPESVDGPASALDVHKETQIWVRRTWRLFAALESFAMFQEQNPTQSSDFRSYCAAMPSPPLAARQISMRESSTVKNNRRLHAERVFEVPAAVDPSGSAYMGAHARVTSSGKPPAPRAYFLDDTRGATGMVHVGYVGEHLTTTATSST